MLGLKIPVGNEVWACLIHFAQLLERLCANSSTHSDLVILESEIKSFFSEFIGLFPEVNMKLKAHFLIHYPTIIRRFSPLVKTLRFESKHSYFKSSLSGNKNRKNVWLSLAKRHQYMMYLHYSKEFLLEHNCPRGVGTMEVCTEAFNRNEQVELLRALSLKIDDILTKTHAVYYKGQRYTSEEAVLIGISRDDYQCGLIGFAILFRGVVSIFCEVLKTVCYNFHYNSYKLLEQYFLIDMGRLLDYHPIGIYKVGLKSFVPLRHFVHTEYDD